jgi:hypothetical protein
VSRRVGLSVQVWVRADRFHLDVLLAEAYALARHSNVTAEAMARRSTKITSMAPPFPYPKRFLGGTSGWVFAAVSVARARGVCFGRRPCPRGTSSPARRAASGRLQLGGCQGPSPVRLKLQVGHKSVARPCLAGTVRGSRCESSAGAPRKGRHRPDRLSHAIFPGTQPEDSHPAAGPSWISRCHRALAFH